MYRQYSSYTTFVFVVALIIVAVEAVSFSTAPQYSFIVTLRTHEQSPCKPGTTHHHSILSTTYIHYTFWKTQYLSSVPPNRTLTILVSTAATYSNALSHLLNPTQQYHPGGDHLCALCAHHQATNNAVGHVNNRFTEIKRTITRFFLFEGSYRTFNTLVAYRFLLLIFVLITMKKKIFFYI